MRMFNFRIYPREKQIKKMFKILDNSTEVWNDLLNQKSQAWKDDKKSLTRGELYKLISQSQKKERWYKSGNSHIYQNVSVRLIDSYTGFFSRCKNPSFRNKEKGYPKEKKRVFSFTFPEYRNGCEIIGNKLWLSKIGYVPIIIHREINTEKIKTITIKRKPSGKWFASFSVDICEQKKIKEVKIDLSNPIGIDVGCPNIVNLSNQMQIPNPKYYLKSQARLKILQRRVSRKHMKKGKKVFSNHSNNRRKAVWRLARLHEKVDNQRNDFQHKLSLWIARNFTFIAVEKLMISNMVKNHKLAKSINDSAWGSLFQKLDYKSYGKLFYNQKTPYSSCTCAICNNIQENPLSENSDDFVCEKCGNIIQKDWNASINHLKNTLEELGLKILIIKIDDIYFLETNNKVIQLNNQTKFDDIVGNTKISGNQKKLMEKLPILSCFKNKLASNLKEVRNTFADG